MAGEVNRVPLGLLSILDMKARGQNPRTLSELVQATVDISDLYLFQNRELGQDGVGVSSSGSSNFNNGPLVVPQDEIWRIHNVTMYPSGSLSAGTALSYGIGWLAQPNNRAIYLGPALTPTLIWTATPGAPVSPVAAYAEPFWAPPGSWPIVWVPEFVAGLVDPLMLAEVWFTRVSL